MSFEVPSQLSEKKSPFDLEDLNVRLEAKSGDPTFQEKCAGLYAKYGKKMRRPMIALVTALALSFESYPVFAQEQGASPEPQVQSAEDAFRASEKVGMTVERYRALSPEDQTRELNKHSEGVKKAIDAGDKSLFEFHLGEVEKIVETIEDRERRTEIQHNISKYKQISKIFFGLYEKEPK